MPEGARTARAILGVILLLMAFSVSPGASSEQGAKSGFQEVRVQGVLRDPRTTQPVVLLADLAGDRGMMIWIGEAEAAALDGAIQGTRNRRPMTHDLLASVVEKLDARIDQVRVTELRDDVYYASIFLISAQGQTEVDARPSDALVLAVRVKCPISVEASLFLARSVLLNVRPVRLYGMEVQELTQDLKAALGYHGEGVLVSQVEPEGLADKSGLHREDILVEVAGESVRSVADLENLRPASRGGLEVKVFRKGKILSLTLPPLPAP